MEIDDVSLMLPAQEQLAAIEQIIREALVSGRHAIRRIGAGFLAIRQRDLWNLTQDENLDFFEYCWTAFGLESRNVKYAMDAERAFRTIEHAQLQLPSNDGQAVELARLHDEDRQIDVWRRVLEMCAEQNLGITVMRVREAVTQEKEDIRREAVEGKDKKKTKDKPAKVPKGIDVDMGDEDELHLTERGEEALARIKALCGDVVATAIREKRNAKLTEAAVRQWAEQDDDTVTNLVYYCIDRVWSVRKALNYLSRIIDGDTQVDELILMARNQGGRFSGMHGDARIIVEIMLHPDA